MKLSDAVIDWLIRWLTPQTQMQALAKPAIFVAVIVCWGLVVEGLVRPPDRFFFVEFVLVAVVTAMPFIFIPFALFLKLSEMKEEQRRLASTDMLTDLPNRREFMRAAQRSQKGAQDVLLMLDVDHFKRVNDTYGHDAGDECLKAVGQLIRDTVGEGDLAARLGGEEFVVLLRTPSMSRLSEVSRRLVAGPSLTLSDGRVLSPTISVGAATWKASRSMTEMLRLADEALYAAKKAGRARMVLADERDGVVIPLHRELPAHIDNVTALSGSARIN